MIRKRIAGQVEHVVVVGAGLAGLSATLHLLGSGHAVTVLEREPHPGGRAGGGTLAGHPVDTGATVLTMPELADDALAAVGDSLAARLRLVRLRPAYRARFADGSVLDVHADPDVMADQIASVIGHHEVAGYLRLRRWLTELYRVQLDAFIARNFDSPTDLLSPRLLPQLARLAALGGFGRLGPRVAGFVTDERLRRLFTFQSLYAGVAPDRALGAYGVIAYLDTVAGVYYPHGGVRALPAALAASAAGAGAVLRYRTEVTGLEQRAGRVTAVYLAGGERIGCDAVVLTPDLPVSYRLLGRTPSRPVPLRWAPSAFLLTAVTDRWWSWPAHHTLLFGRAWRRTFTEITTGGRLMSDPSLLLTSPTVTEPVTGPADAKSGGRHLVQLLAPCPNLVSARIDWPRLADRYAEELVGVLERRGLPGFGAAVQAVRLTTPADWDALGLAAGTPFSAAHTFAQTGPFRPGNLVRGAAANAVLAGCGTTPGVGIPTALISGRLAAARVAAMTVRDDRPRTAE